MMFEYEEVELEETTPEEASEETEESAAETTLESAPEAEPEEPKYKVIYNGEEMELAVSELITSAQKGMNYDHVKGDLDNQRKTSAEATAALDRLTTALNQFGYAGGAQEIADMLEAQRREVEPEQVRREREAQEAQEAARNEAEAARAEAAAIRRDAVFARDLLEIQRMDPNVKSLADLGDQFFKLRAAGIGNVEAYELLRHKPTKKQEPAGKDHLMTTGGGNSSGGLMDIPKGEYSLWRESFPDDTPAKLKERYNRSVKRQSK